MDRRKPVAIPVMIEYANTAGESVIVFFRGNYQLRVYGSRSIFHESIKIAVVVAIRIVCVGARHVPVGHPGGP